MKTQTTMRLIRLLVLNNYLTGKNVNEITRKELARIFRVSMRTIYRDLKVLKLVQFSYEYLKTQNRYPDVYGTWEQVREFLTPRRPEVFDMVRELEKARRQRPPGGFRGAHKRKPAKKFF